MEAARVAALRGHDVTIYEKNSKLGGQLLLASVPPWKAPDLANLIRYLETQVKKLGVKIKFGNELSSEQVAKLGPDVVIVATGATPLIPKIRGIESEKVMTANDVLAGDNDVGNKIVVLGGGRVGCETALFLAKKGKKVTIVEQFKSYADEMPPASRDWLSMELDKAGVNIIVNVNPQEIKDEGLIMIDQKWRETAVEADTIVVAVGTKPNGKLFEELRNKVPELYAIGDCLKPGTIGDAIRDGWRVAREI